MTVVPAARVVTVATARVATGGGSTAPVRRVQLPESSSRSCEFTSPSDCGSDGMLIARTTAAVVSVVAALLLVMLKL